MRFGDGDLLRLGLDFSDGFFLSSSFLTTFLLGLLLLLLDAGFLFNLARAADESLELLDEEDEDDRELLPELLLDPLELELLLDPLRLLESLLDPDDDARDFLVRSLPRSFFSSFSFFDSSFLLDESLSFEDTAISPGLFWCS